MLTEEFLGEPSFRFDLKPPDIPIAGDEETREDNGQIMNALSLMSLETRPFGLPCRHEGK